MDGKFLWGTASAAHQIEGNNVNSDFWLVEHVTPTLFKEPSGDACDSLHRYAEDTALAASLGFNAHRFGIEWARIEPEPGEFSPAALDHYKRVLEDCHANGRGSNRSRANSHRPSSIITNAWSMPASSAGLPRC